MARRKKKKFNELTPVEKYQRLRKQGYSCVAMKWISILSPYITIGIVNFDEYFVESDGVKMSLGCILAMIVAGISILNETKENKKISGLVGWSIAFALVYFFQAILQDLVLIIGCGLIGQLIGSGFELGANIQLEKASLYRQGNIQAETRNKGE